MRRNQKYSFPEWKITYKSPKFRSLTSTACKCSSSDLRSIVEAVNDVLSKVNETITINLGLGRAVSLQCSDFLDLTEQFLEAVTRTDDSLYGLAGQIMFAVVRPCQASQLNDIKQFKEQIEDAREAI